MHQFTHQDIAQLVEQYYGLNVSVKSCPGYDEGNYQLADQQGKKYILKIAGNDHGLDFIRAQIETLNFLGKSELANKIPHCLLAKDGSYLQTIDIRGTTYYWRILSYLEGTFWSRCKAPSILMMRRLGEFLGKMDRLLADFYHPAIRRRYVWDLANTLDASAQVGLIPAHDKRRLAEYFLSQFEQEVQPQLSSLRSSVVHNDANDENILIHGDEIAGLIDFGDMVYTQTIHNLAIACTYVMLKQPDPIACAAAVVGGYHALHPLTETEVALLYYLIAGRLCISVCQAAYYRANGSTNAHHFVTEAMAWNLLFRLIQINPLQAHNAFRLACGFSPILADGNYQSLLEQRKKYIGRNLSISYQTPLKIVRGALQYLYDDQGHTFVDCVNNVSHVGHCHPQVVQAIKKQAAVLNTNTRYLHDHIINYSQKLLSLLPDNLQVCYFTNSGSEANDLAIRMSRHFTASREVIVLDHAYHGTSTLAMELSPYKFDGRGGFGQKPYIHKAENPDLYRGRFKYGDALAGVHYAADVRRIVRQLQSENKRPAAFICETLLGVGGQIPLPEGYLQEVYDIVRQADGVCIADEVQVGFGRVGDAFWGFELQGVKPDMVVLGKPIGNGHPLAAVITTAEIANAFNNGMEYFNTYGGNPVSMAAGLAVLQVILDEEMQAHAQNTGHYLLERLRQLMEIHPIIGDVRGKGLFIGAELVKDRITLEPAVPQIDIIVEKMKDRGFLLSTDGPLHNVLKIKPPLTFSKENAASLADHLHDVLTEIQ
jgi:4-aminobutyrate aminotransferase-like enzyme/Ser/Thr protein kinase RdoA (MazF antagonist)